MIYLNYNFLILKNEYKADPPEVAIQLSDLIKLNVKPARYPLLNQFLGVIINC